MNLHIQDLIHGILRIPRVSGDEPQQYRQKNQESEYSPRERG